MKEKKKETSGKTCCVLSRFEYLLIGGARVDTKIKTDGRSIFNIRHWIKLIAPLKCNKWAAGWCRVEQAFFYFGARIFL